MFDKKFMVEGLVCVSSILEYGPDAKVFVLCLDQEVDKIVQRHLSSDRVVCIQLLELEYKYPAIAATKPSRPWAPYTQSLKPFLPEYIFNTHGTKALTYVDSDMLFWGDCSEIDREMGDCSFMVTSRGQDPPPDYGYFNGGCFSCRDDRNCRLFLTWWQDRCVEWCLWQTGPNGAFGEEGYLNIIVTEPNRFGGIHVSRHPGINLAPWNVKMHKLESWNGGFVVDGHFPLVCYHYQGFGGIKFPSAMPVDMMFKKLTALYAPYRDKLSATTKVTAAVLPPENMALDGRKIYQEGGVYRKRMRANLL